MNIPNQAIALIKQFEGCRLSAYQDIRGIWTIGFGETAGVTEGMTITQEQADEYLARDLQSFAAAIDRLITTKLNDNQFSALLDFTYNLGSGTLQRSTLRMQINRGELSGIPRQLEKYCYAGTIKSTGLIRRRQAETTLWSTPV